MPRMDRLWNGMWNVRQKLRGEEGQSLVEFALTSSVLLTFVFCLMQSALAFYSFNMISEAAREGTRYAMVRGSSCTTSTNASCTATAAQINSYVTGLGWPNLAGGTLTPSTTYPDGNQNPASRVQVTVQYVLPVHMPYVPVHSMSMSATSVAYIVQ